MIVLLIALMLCFNPLARADEKPANQQDEIILLNDCASAVEDADPVLSKILTAMADTKEKEWEAGNADKEYKPPAVSPKDIPALEKQIEALKTAAYEIKPVYPVIAANLKKIIKETQRKIESVQ
jgi:hypothetical protein